jgi:hypothetical protein
MANYWKHWAKLKGNKKSGIKKVDEKSNEKKWNKIERAKRRIPKETFDGSAAR